MPQDSNHNYTSADISEDEIKNFDEKLLETLLKDYTSKKNIIFGTDNYISNNNKKDYLEKSEITIEKITGENQGLIKPRVNKTIEEQENRKKDKAEVFTPNWVINEQVNLVEEKINNKPPLKIIDSDKKLTKDEEKSLEDYITKTHLEISCGEAPYITTRYDVAEGSEGTIKFEERVGILDRKFRAIYKLLESESEKFPWDKFFDLSIKAIKSVYGFEFQGDSLLIARENILYSFLDFYFYAYQKQFKGEASISSGAKTLLEFFSKTHKEGEQEAKDFLLKIVDVIYKNFFQMDALEGNIPYSKSKKVKIYNWEEEKVEVFKNVADEYYFSDTNKIEGQTDLFTHDALSNI